MENSVRISKDKEKSGCGDGKVRTTFPGIPNQGPACDGLVRGRTAGSRASRKPAESRRGGKDSSGRKGKVRRPWEAAGIVRFVGVDDRDCRTLLTIK